MRKPESALLILLSLLTSAIIMCNWGSVEEFVLVQHQKFTTADFETAAVFDPDQLEHVHTLLQRNGISAIVQTTSLGTAAVPRRVLARTRAILAADAKSKGYWLDLSTPRSPLPPVRLPAGF
jgi:hypothetical protein